MEKYILCFIVFAMSLILTLFIESKILPILKRNAKQPIYDEGPSWHISKAGTPTMGGVAFVVASSLSLLIYTIASTFLFKDIKVGVSIIIALFFALGNGLIGVFDDLMKLYRKKNGGLTPIQKIILQSLISIIFLMARRYFLQDEPTVRLPFMWINLGALYYPMCMIILLGIVNCANLTDGIDGLASSVAISISCAFLLLDRNLSSDAPILAAATLGGALGFLYFNAHPAKIFMGDTGSLFLGALAVAMSFSAGNPLFIVVIGSVYVIEGISVILQVAIYKLTKKRLFKMAPIHHHLEKSGLDENRICVSAVIVTLFSSALLLMLIGV